MEGLFPIIRRVRRSLLPPEEKTALVVPGLPLETSATIANVASESLTAAPSVSGTRAQALRAQKKGKAD